MARLVVHPRSAAPWEIRLKPGENLIGRSITNHFQISDPSVSSSHCRITLNEGTVQITDLGSTNGTFVNRSPVQQAMLETGCSVQLGDVQLVYYADDAAATVATYSAPEPLVSGSVAAPVPRVAAPLAGSGQGKLKPSQHCKFHPAMAARYRCSKCQRYFCETCVATRSGGAQGKFCRHCGVECEPVQVQYEAVVEKTFLERLPGAFLYPLRGAGIIIVIVGIFLVGTIKWGQALFRYGSARAIIFGCILEMFAGGYLFTYLQGIVHSTTAEDRELPDLPGISNFLEDVIVPFFRLLGLTLFCFGPALGTGIWALKTHEPAAVWTFVAVLVLACLFYPMAFLSVAIHDSVTAANPLLVVPSIIKVSGKYLMALLLLVLTAAVQWFGGLAVTKFFPEGSTTHAMGEFLAMIGVMAFVSFLTLYLLIIVVHLLGLIFLTSKDDLGWLRS